MFFPDPKKQEVWSEIREKGQIPTEKQIVKKVYRRPDIPRLGGLLTQECLRESNDRKECASTRDPFCARTRKSGPRHGCQIFLDTMYQNGEKHTKLPQNMHTTWLQNISNCRKIEPMTIKYTNVFQFKALQNFPKLRFLV
jgi:hypothetical protein